MCPHLKKIQVKIVLLYDRHKISSNYLHFGLHAEGRLSQNIEIIFKPIVNDQKIGEINITDEQEDGEKCRGNDSSALKFILEEVSKSGILLESLGYLTGQSALEKNTTLCLTLFPFLYFHGCFCINYSGDPVFRR